jgi:hypothetical protein
VKDAIMTAVINYFIRVSDAVSQLLNVVFLFSQNPNESISGRCYRMRYKKQWQIAMAVIDFLFSPIEVGHCEKSYDKDVLRASELLKNKGL